MVDKLLSDVVDFDELDVELVDDVVKSCVKLDFDCVDVELVVDRDEGVELDVELLLVYDVAELVVELDVDRLVVDSDVVDALVVDNDAPATVEVEDVEDV